LTLLQVKEEFKDNVVFCNGIDGDKGPTVAFFDAIDFPTFWLFLVRANGTYWTLPKHTRLASRPKPT
jgi:hypothetical protein